MKLALVVALGGAIGSVLRYLLSLWVVQHTPDWRFPVATFAVNVLGCLLVGVLAGVLVKHDVFSPEVRLFLFTGLAGGFTTFSAFGLETFSLIERAEILIAGGYVVASVVIGLAVLWLGFSLVSTLPSPLS